MSQENVEVVRRAYERGGRGLEETLSAIDEFADPDVEVRATGHLPDLADVGVVRGREAFKAYFMGLFEVFDYWRSEPEEFIDVGDRVIVPVVQIGRGKGSGAEVRTPVVHVWAFRGSKIAYMDVYRSKGEALEAAGLSE